MTAPSWMNLGHPVRAAQIKRELASRERRRGGRVLTPASWAEEEDRLTAEHEAHKRRIGEVGAMLDRIEAAFAERIEG